MSEFVENALRAELLGRLRACGIRDGRKFRHFCRIASKVARAFADFQFRISRGEFPRDYFLISIDEAADKAAVLSNSADLIANIAGELADDDYDGHCPTCGHRFRDDGSCCDECGWARP